MSNTTFGLPVSVEQIAAVIQQMNRDERQRLLKLVPELNGKQTPRVRKQTAKRPQYAFAQVRALLRDVSRDLSADVNADRADRV